MNLDRKKQALIFICLEKRRSSLHSPKEMFSMLATFKLCFAFHRQVTAPIQRWGVFFRCKSITCGINSSCKMGNIHEGKNIMMRRIYNNYVNITGMQCEVHWIDKWYKEMSWKGLRKLSELEEPTSGTTAGVVPIINTHLPWVNLREQEYALDEKWETVGRKPGFLELDNPCWFISSQRRTASPCMHAWASERDGEGNQLKETP